MVEYHEDLRDLAPVDLFYQSKVRLEELKRRLSDMGQHDLAHKVIIALEHLEVVARTMEHR